MISDVGALGRQQADGRPARRRLEHEEPDQPINLTYIPHTEMVGKIAQGIASGEVPDLMGMDLIYAPQFEKAQQLVDLTDRIQDWPELKTASKGHMTVATYEDRLYGVPLYADVSALFYNKDPLRQGRPRPGEAADQPGRAPPYADKITALGGDVKGYYLPGNCAGCNIFTVGPLMWASGAKIEAAGAATSRSPATASSRCSSSPATWSRPATCTRATGPRTARRSTSSSAPARSA